MRTEGLPYDVCEELFIEAVGVHVKQNAFRAATNGKPTFFDTEMVICIASHCNEGEDRGNIHNTQLSTIPGSKLHGGLLSRGVQALPKKVNHNSPPLQAAMALCWLWLELAVVFAYRVPKRV